MAKKNNKSAALTEAPELTIEEQRDADALAIAEARTDFRGNKLPEIPRSFNYKLGEAERVRNAFDYTFMLLGGVPSFALWAAENPTEFYKLFSKMVPAANNVLQSNGPVTIITNVPDSPLDKVEPITVDSRKVDFD